jgi:hypothetical protein
MITALHPIIYSPDVCKPLPDYMASRSGRFTVVRTSNPNQILFYPENGGSKFLRNVGTFLPV